MYNKFTMSTHENLEGDDEDEDDRCALGELLSGNFAGDEDDVYFVPISELHIKVMETTTTCKEIDHESPDIYANSSVNIPAGSDHDIYLDFKAFPEEEESDMSQPSTITNNSLCMLGSSDDNPYLDLPARIDNIVNVVKNEKNYADKLLIDSNTKLQEDKKRPKIVQRIGSKQTAGGIGNVYYVEKKEGRNEDNIAHKFDVTLYQKDNSFGVSESEEDTVSENTSPLSKRRNIRLPSGLPRNCKIHCIAISVIATTLIITGSVLFGHKTYIQTRKEITKPTVNHDNIATSQAIITTTTASKTTTSKVTSTEKVTLLNYKRKNEVKKSATIEMTKNGLQYKAVSAKLESVPQDIDRNTKILILSKNLIKKTSQANGLHKLTELDMSYNKLTQLPIMLMTVGRSLVSLYLQGNEILHLNKSLLSQLTRLEVLDLSNNLILKYPDVGTPSEKLNLDSNSIKNFPKLTKNVKLKYIYMNKNKMKDIPIRNVVYMYGVKEVHLAENDLKYIPPFYQHNLNERPIVNVTRNPLNCDANLIWMATSYKTNSNCLGYCFEPKNMRGHCINKINTDLWVKPLSSVRSQLCKTCYNIIMPVMKMPPSHSSKKQCEDACVKQKGCVYYNYYTGSSAWVTSKCHISTTDTTSWSRNFKPKRYDGWKVYIIKFMDFSKGGSFNFQLSG